MYYLVSVAAACVRHPAGHVIIIYLFIYSFIYHLVPATAAACVRHHAVACCRPFLSFMHDLFTIYLLFSVCSSSVRQASCWSCHYCLLIYINLSFRVCSSSLHEASYSSMLPAFIIYLLYIYLLSVDYLVSAAAA
jgi:hypothetical protein